MDKVITKPSLKVSFLIIAVYLFAAVPVTMFIVHLMTLAGYSADNIKYVLSEIIISTQTLITVVLSFLILKRYLVYLLSDGWKKNFFLYIKVGLKWAFPLLVLHAFSMLVPIIRENLISRYLSLNIISVKKASIFTLSIFSFWLIIGAIFEEFFFRGIIVNKLQTFTNKTASVLISAIFFALSHFVFSKISIGMLTSSFMVGVFSGFAYTSTGSCISAILPHLINNIICAGFAIYSSIHVSG